MSTLFGSHQPVLLAEALQGLAVDAAGVYVDATFGRGGHARALLTQLGPRGKLVAFDRDSEAVSAAVALKTDARFTILQDSFAEMVTQLDALHLVGQIHGVLMDLGVSSPQLDDPERGFSFTRDGPLDMRMDTRSGLSAAEWLNDAEPEAIAQVLRDYGEERFARRIAAAIARARQKAPIERTLQLADIVREAHPAWEKHKHPATRSFQAIRIFINQELEALQQGLRAALEVLRPGGRLAVISFQSLEDRIVKRFIRDEVRGERYAIPVSVPIKETAFAPRLRRIGRLIKPSAEETSHNVRARSARLRIAEKVA